MKRMEFTLKQRKYIARQESSHTKEEKGACLAREMTDTKALEWERMTVGAHVSLGCGYRGVLMWARAILPQGLASDCQELRFDA